MIVEKPWGYERIIEKNATYVVKELVVNPGHRLSLQYHEKKKETMMLVAGDALLQLESETEKGKLVNFRMRPFIPYYIQVGQTHRLISDGLDRARVVEVSTTELDDIVRLEDDYKRIV